MHAVLFDPEPGLWRHFDAPEAVLRARRLDEVSAVLAEVTQATMRRGLHAVGFITYEAAPAFDEALQVVDGELSGQGLPLVQFGLYRECTLQVEGPLPVSTASPPGPWRADRDRDAYGLAVEKVRAHIEAGDCYQVNLTHRLKASLHGDTREALKGFVAGCRCAYAAWLDLGPWALASSSPELFFAHRGDRLWSRPMKGTAPRGVTPEEDRRAAAWLARSEKNRAENVMITDMIRNDMGRVARPGSVRVPQLYRVERLPTAWQMTSTVTCETDAAWSEVLGALFPCASITGAPKARAMSIIRELETSPRGVYTGAIGWVAPGGDAQFSVAIRTICADFEKMEAEYGVGGGIVWDSTAEDEWEECQTKARVLAEPTSPFKLLETLLWGPGDGFVLWEEHLNRLTASAEYFEIACEREALESALRAAVEGFETAQRVRLTVDQAGRPEVSVAALAPLPQPYRLAPAARPVASGDRFLYHKTTRRDVYDEARRQHPGLEDVVLWNEAGEVTETTIANLAIERDGQLVTPPVRCGLLAGTQRAAMLARGEVVEGVVTLAELKRAGRVWLFNSVRGCWWGVVGSVQ